MNLELSDILIIIPLFILCVLGINPLLRSMIRNFFFDNDDQCMCDRPDKQAIESEIANWLFCTKRSVLLVIDGIRAKTKSEHTRTYEVTIKEPSDLPQNTRSNCFEHLFCHLEGHYFDSFFESAGQIENPQTIFIVECENYYKQRLLPYPFTTSEEVMDPVSVAKIKEIIHNKERWIPRKQRLSLIKNETVEF